MIWVISIAIAVWLAAAIVAVLILHRQW